MGLGLYNPQNEGKDYKWYISGIFPANWVIIYYRSHPLQEPKKIIESMEVSTNIISKLGYFAYLEDEINLLI